MREWLTPIRVMWPLLLIPGLIGAQWKWIGPPGGILNGFAQAPSDPNIIYAIGQAWPCNLFKSTDHGQTWNRCGPSNGYPYDLAVHPTSPSTIHLSGGYRWYTSTNSGSSWTTSDLPSNTYLFHIKLQPGNPSIIHGVGYYYDTDLNITQLTYHRSTNGGTTWDIKKVLTEYSYPYAVAPDPTNPQIVYVGGSRTVGKSQYPIVYKSTNGGVDFVEKADSIKGIVYDLAHDPATSGKLYAGTSAGVFRTTDGGTTWIMHSGYTIYSVQRLQVSPTNSSVLYAGLYSGVGKSTDGGINWVVMTTGLKGSSCLALSVENASTVFNVSSAGVFRTTNGGTVWTCQNAGLSVAGISAIAISPSNPSVVYTGISGDAVYKSTNAGQATVAWARIPDFYSCTEVADIVASPTSPDILYALEGGT